MTTGPANQPGRGLQNERTTMAWVRTTLAFVAVGVLVARQAGTALIAVVVATAVFVAAGSMLWVAERAHVARHGAVDIGAPVAAPTRVAAAALSVTAVACCALAIVVV